MKSNLPNPPCLIYSGLSLIGIILTGLLLTTKNHSTAGISTAITFIIMVFCLSWGIFPIPSKNVRPRNILRIFLIVTLFHMTPILFNSGLFGIDHLCKTKHLEKISETAQKTYFSIKTPYTKIRQLLTGTFGKIVQTPEKNNITNPNRSKNEQKENPLKNYFSLVYLIFCSSILICLYKILLSWGGYAFLLGVLALILLLVYLQYFWHNPPQQKALYSLLFLAPLIITIYLGKNQHQNPATT